MEVYPCRGIFARHSGSMYGQDNIIEMSNWFTACLFITAIVVGFEETSFEVLEGAGSVVLCISTATQISRPDVEFSLTATTLDGTASKDNEWPLWSYLAASYTVTSFIEGRRDFLPFRDQLVGPFNSESARHCFVVSIVNDFIAETRPETFTVRVQRPEDLYYPTIQPDEVTITILDNDCKMLYKA